jgi:transposase-like protein
MASTTRWGVTAATLATAKRSKTLLTEVGPVPIEMPRDRDGTFTPTIVGKRQRWLGGIDDLVISLTAKGLTTGEVAAYLTEVYGAQVSKDHISHHHRTCHGLVC